MRAFVMILPGPAMILLGSASPAYRKATRPVKDMSAGNPWPVLRRLGGGGRRLGGGGRRLGGGGRRRGRRGGRGRRRRGRRGGRRGGRRRRHGGRRRLHDLPHVGSGGLPARVVVVVEGDLSLGALEDPCASHLAPTREP